MSPGRPGLSVGDRILVGFVGRIGPILLRLLGSSWRATEIHFERAERVHESGRPVVFAFWHGVLLPLEYICRGRKKIKDLSQRLKLVEGLRQGASPHARESGRGARPRGHARRP